MDDKGAGAIPALYFYNIILWRRRRDIGTGGRQAGTEAAPWAAENFGSLV